MKRTILLILALTVGLSLGLPVGADNNETEMTGGFVPVIIGTGGGLDSEPLPEPVGTEEPGNGEPAAETEFPGQTVKDESLPPLIGEGIGSSETELSVEIQITPKPENALSETENIPEAAGLLFTDASSIGAVYLEAVKAMAEKGVLNGFEDNSFRPKAYLTREQGAKIVTYLLLGHEEAEALQCEKSPFTDVASERWSAASIAWCAENQILHGMGDGSFRPEETLTGAQFAKMLLCAYGLGEPERYVGDDWLMNISADGDELSIFAGDEKMRDNTPLERQQAALLSVNAGRAAG